MTKGLRSVSPGVKRKKKLLLTSCGIHSKYYTITPHSYSVTQFRKKYEHLDLSVKHTIVSYSSDFSVEHITISK